jgi:hypothetical protein
LGWKLTKLDKIAKILKTCKFVAYLIHTTMSRSNRAMAPQASIIGQRAAMAQAQSRQRAARVSSHRGLDLIEVLDSDDEAQEVARAPPALPLYRPVSPSYMPVVPRVSPTAPSPAPEGQGGGGGGGQAEDQEEDAEQEEDQAEDEGEGEEQEGEEQEGEEEEAEEAPPTGPLVVQYVLVFDATSDEPVADIIELDDSSRMKTLLRRTLEHNARNSLNYRRYEQVDKDNMQGLADSDDEDACGTMMHFLQVEADRLVMEIEHLQHVGFYISFAPQ